MTPARSTSPTNTAGGTRFQRLQRWLVPRRAVFQRGGRQTYVLHGRDSRPRLAHRVLLADHWRGHVAADGEKRNGLVPASLEGRKPPFIGRRCSTHHSRQASCQGEFSFRVVDALALPADARQEPNALQRWRQEVVRSWKTIELLAPEAVRAFPGKGLPDDLGHGTAESFTRNSGGWATIRVPVEKAAGTQMTMGAPIGYLWHYWGSMHMMCGPRSTGYVENALSLLDQAGEWYLERKTGLLCYIPGQGSGILPAGGGGPGVRPGLPGGTVPGRARGGVGNRAGRGMPPQPGAGMRGV